MKLILVCFIVLLVCMSPGYSQVSLVIEKEDGKITYNYVDSVGRKGKKRALQLNEKLSLINWQDLNVKQWLNLDTWLAERKIKDNSPYWQIRKRANSLNEIVGRVAKCFGKCKIIRGVQSHTIDYLSKVYELDEIQTDEDSYLLVYLVDGTLLRVAAESSIVFNEINISRTEVFHFVRVNYGNIYWQTRNPNDYESHSDRDTDTIFFPLPFDKANPEVPETFAYKEDELFENVTAEIDYKKHGDILNLVMFQNNQNIKAPKKSKLFLVAPNLSFYGENPIIDIYTLLNNETYIKKKSLKSIGFEDKISFNSTGEVYFRGFENRRKEVLENDTWYSMDRKGTTLSPLTENIPVHLKIGEILTKRWTSIYILREAFFNKFSRFVFREIGEEELGAKYGYRLWDAIQGLNEIEQRVDFLKEYTRRVETSNLKTSLQYYGNKDKFDRDRLKLSNRFYIKAYNDYYNFRLTPFGNLKDDGLNSTEKKFWKLIQKRIIRERNEQRL